MWMMVVVVVMMMNDGERWSDSDSVHLDLVHFGCWMQSEWGRGHRDGTESEGLNENENESESVEGEEALDFGGNDDHQIDDDLNVDR